MVNQKAIANTTMRPTNPRGLRPTSCPVRARRSLNGNVLGECPVMECSSFLPAASSVSEPYMPSVGDAEILSLQERFRSITTKKLSWKPFIDEGLQTEEFAYYNPVIWRRCRVPAGEHARYGRGTIDTFLRYPAAGQSNVAIPSRAASKRRAAFAMCRPASMRR